MDSYYYYCYYSVLVWYCWDDGSNQSSSSLGYWSMTLLLFVVSLRISMVCGFPSPTILWVGGVLYRFLVSIQCQRTGRGVIIYILWSRLTRNEYGMENRNHRFPVLVPGIGYGVGHCAKRDDRASISFESNESIYRFVPVFNLRRCNNRINK